MALDQGIHFAESDTHQQKKYSFEKIQDKSNKLVMFTDVAFYLEKINAFVVSTHNIGIK